MSYHNSSFKKQNYKTISEEKFDQILDAILDGKYSWACVLMLQTAGYNPLHYIPHRTYNRLIKNNSISSQSKYASTKQQKTTKTHNQNFAQIQDLNCLSHPQNK